MSKLDFEEKCILYWEIGKKKLASSVGHLSNDKGGDVSMLSKCQWICEGGVKAVYFDTDSVLSPELEHPVWDDGLFFRNKGLFTQ